MLAYLAELLGQLEERHQKSYCIMLCADHSCELIDRVGNKTVLGFDNAHTLLAWLEMELGP